MTGGGNKVLVLETDQKNNLVERLYDCGFMPILRESIPQAIAKFRDGDFRAVVIRRDIEAIDPLEFIVSLREVDHHTPVVIIGEIDDAYREKLLQIHRRVYFVADKDADFRDCLQAIIADTPGDIADG